MSFYSDIQATATRLITDKGQNLTFGRETSSGFDPILGVNTTTSSTYTGYGVSTQYNKKEIDGTIIQIGDIKLILQKTTTDPLRGDTVTVDSIVYRVMDIEPVSPAGTVVIRKLQLRK